MEDILYKGLLFDGSMAFYAINGTFMCENAKRTMNASATCTAALGRSLMGTTLLGSMHKNENYKVTTVFKGDGPAGTIVCVADNNGTVKGYVTNPEVELAKNAVGKLDVAKAIGKGTFRVVSDEGYRDPYIGEVEIVSGEVAQDFANYFYASTQTPSLVYLGVHISKDFFVEAASGIIIMPLPNCPKTDIETIEKKADQIAMLTKDLKETQDLKAVLDNIFADCNLQYTQTINPVYQCDCSRERLEEVLISLGENELMDIIKKDKGAQVNCQFCKKSYQFNQEQLIELINLSKEN